MLYCSSCSIMGSRERSPQRWPGNKMAAPINVLALTRRYHRRTANAIVSTGIYKSLQWLLQYTVTVIVSKTYSRKSALLSSNSLAPKRDKCCIQKDHQQPGNCLKMVLLSFVLSITATDFLRLGKTETAECISCWTPFVGARATYLYAQDDALTAS